MRMICKYPINLDTERILVPCHDAQFRFLELDSARRAAYTGYIWFDVWIGLDPSFYWYPLHLFESLEAIPTEAWHLATVRDGKVVRHLYRTGTPYVADGREDT